MKDYANLSDSDDNIKNLTDMRFFFLGKIFVHTSKEKNDFVSFGNCLDSKFDKNKIHNITEFNRKNYDINFQPIYIIGIADDISTKSQYKDSLIFEKYNYILSYCLPYGKFKTGEDICSKEDYGNIMKIILEISFNMDTSNVDCISIYDHKKIDGSEYTIGIISILIIILPIILYIILLIYKKFTFKKFEKKNNNNLKNNEEKEIENNTNISDLISEISTNKQFGINIPNWYKCLKEYFNLIKNGKELFNSNQTLLNNVNGLTYIKGLLGISMILYIFGHTYLILINLPFKFFSYSNYHSSLTNPFYFIVIIGLRYSPRIILSCSGYTFIFKYLSFIKNHPNYYLPQFLLLQSYKYILLFFVVLYMRYSFYHIENILNHEKRPMLEIYNYILDYQSDTFEKFFTFLFDFNRNFAIQYRQNLIQYFYLPINEVFLFIISIIFISIGYRFKFRIDIIIIIIVIILFLFKIMDFSLRLYDLQNYTTSYYYLFSYGGLMLIPIYNLSCFFIGIFFGLINYSIQNGVDFERNTRYQRLNSNRKDHNKFSINEVESDKEIQIKKIVTFKGNLLNRRLSNSNSINSKNIDYNQQNDNRSRALTTSTKIQNNQKFSLYPNNIMKNKRKSLENPENNTIIEDIKEENGKIENIPFLKWPTYILNFHRNNESNPIFIILMIFFALLISLIVSVHFIFIIHYYTDNQMIKESGALIENKSLKNVISNFAFNFIYVIDIDLVVFLSNWGLFILYSKGSKSADIYGFFNSSFWSFFIKCYYSFILISTPVILGIFYIIETQIKLTIVNIILFSAINMLLIFFAVIIFYSLYEIPLKKLFKTILNKDKIFGKKTNDKNDENDYYEMEEK